MAIVVEFGKRYGKRGTGVKQQYLYIVAVEYYWAFGRGAGMYGYNRLTYYRAREGEDYFPVGTEQHYNAARVASACLD